MKITELKKLLNDRNDELLKKTIVEVYKFIPTSKKPDVDYAIACVLSGDTKQKDKAVEKVDYNKLSEEINDFLQNAYAQNYFAPNRTIPKSARPKWRFLVKGYVKELEKVQLDSEFYDEAVELLVKLYRMMCYACNYYLFSTTDSFKSVGITQGTFYSLVANKMLAKGYTSEKINTLLVCACTGGLSTESLYISQESILLSLLNDEDVLNLTIDEAQKLIDATNQKLIKDNNKYSNNSYFLQEEINNLCETILMIKIKLNEVDEGIKYCFDNMKERDKEIILYCVLDTIAMFTDDDDLWIRAYEYGINKRKIKPREELKETYENLLKG